MPSLQPKSSTETSFASLKGRLVICFLVAGLLPLLGLLGLLVAEPWLGSMHPWWLAGGWGLIVLGGGYLLSQLFFRTLLQHALLENHHLLAKEIREKTQDLEKFKLAVEHAFHQILITDPKGIILYANKAFVENTGFTQKDIVGKKMGAPNPWGNLMGEAFYKDFWHTIRDKKKVFTADIINKRKNGKRFEVRMRIIPVLSKQKKVRFYIQFKHDISKEKAMEQKLLQRNQTLEALMANLQKFQTALDNAPDQITLFDADGVILHTNKTFQETVGCSLAQTVGQVIGKKTPWGGLMEPSFYERMWKVLREEKRPFIAEMQNHNKRGELRDLYLEITPIMDEKEKLFFYHSVKRDVTNEKNIERLKNDFVSVASHQLRTPLTAVRWFLEILLDSASIDRKSKEYQMLQDCLIANNRMVSLTNDLLQVSRLEDGRTTVTKQRLDLVSLTKGVIEEQKLSLQKHDLQLKLQAPDKLVVESDLKLLEHVINNLLNNAIKYSPNASKIAIKITATKKEIKWTITDRGMGIPEKDQKRIFTKFFRAQNATKKITNGTGLGLYICSKMIELLGGLMGFTSKEGKGTTMWFSLPSGQ